MPWRSTAPGIREVLVVDAASTDGSAELLEEACPDVRLVRLERNPGPGPARNRAIREARHDRILLLDNDVVLQPGCLDRLLEALDAHPSAVAAFATMRYDDAPDTVQFVAAEPHFLGTMRLLGADRPAADLSSEPFLVGTAPTSCLLVDRTRLPDTAGFDDRLFLYLEDHEWCLRNVLEGRDLVADPMAHCLHGRGTLGVSIRDRGTFTAVRVRQTILNRWQLVLKLYEVRTLIRFAPSLALFEIVQLGGVVRKGWLGHWLWALRELARGWPDLVRRRRAFQARRARPGPGCAPWGPLPLPPGHGGRRNRTARPVGSSMPWSALNWRLAGPTR